MSEIGKYFKLQMNSPTKQKKSGSCGCGSALGSCGSHRQEVAKTTSLCGCGSASGSCSSNKEELPISEQEFFEGAVDAAIGDERKKDGFDQVFDVKMDRRSAFKKLTASLLIGAGAVSSCTSLVASEESKEKLQIDWEEQFKGNYKLMENDEKKSNRK